MIIAVMVTIVTAVKVIISTVIYLQHTIITNQDMPTVSETDSPIAECNFVFYASDSSSIDRKSTAIHKTLALLT
jgi:hypothetical protein